MDGIPLEQAALAAIKAKRLELGMSERELGQAAMPDSKSPATAISKFYCASANNNKNKRLTLADYVALCQALGIAPENMLKSLLEKK